MSAPELGAALLALAETAIRSGLRREPVPPGDLPCWPPEAEELGATFVTLERGDDLLGCLGTIEAVRPLYEDVMQNAYRAAFYDPRLPAVRPPDFRAMSIKVSLLGPLEPLGAVSRVELLANLRPHEDGLLLADGTHRATFLPSVWPKVSGGEEFLALLLQKAGLPAYEWPADLRAWRYRTEEFADPGPRLL